MYADDNRGVDDKLQEEIVCWETFRFFDLNFSKIFYPTLIATSKKV